MGCGTGLNQQSQHCVYISGEFRRRDRIYVIPEILLLSVSRVEGLIFRYADGCSRLWCIPGAVTLSQVRRISSRVARGEFLRGIVLLIRHMKFIKRELILM